MRSREFFLEVVGELRHRFRKLLNMYQTKKADETFNELKKLIENYDVKEDDVISKCRQFGRLGVVKGARVKIDFDGGLQAVQEEDCEDTINDFEN